jgi:4-hydroxythreonine-4-phosphate dehydrogenase
LPLKLIDYTAGSELHAEAGELLICPVALRTACTPGQANPANAAYVIDTLARATDGCLQGEFAALLTAPVHKAVINDAGIAFSGHTEYLAERCGAKLPVMLLCAGDLRVALLTTHLPLAEVPQHVTAERITTVCRILHSDCQRLFGLSKPRIAVLGLNPHAGEDGHLGREEIEIIEPTLDALRAEGLQLSGPLPADSAFTPAALQNCDVVLAMYHDQGLPVLKHAGFGNAVNVTLGLPIVRTSVDHGTALDLAGSGRAKDSSLRSALALTEQILQRHSV